MKTKFETLLSIVNYVKNESNNPIDELLVMGFEPCQLVNEFGFQKQDVKKSELYIQMTDDSIIDIDEKEMPFALENFNPFDASLMFYFEMTPSQLTKFKRTNQYQILVDRYNEERDEALTEVMNRVFDSSSKNINELLLELN